MFLFQNTHILITLLANALTILAQRFMRSKKSHQSNIRLTCKLRICYYLFINLNELINYLFFIIRANLIYTLVVKFFKNIPFLPNLINNAENL